MTVTKMSWRPTYRSSKFRNVYGKVGNREHCFDGIPITKNVHDNHFCAVNSKFLAVVTESAGGGSFIVIPVVQSGRLDSHYPKVCGHQGNVLDIKWNPFFENIVASCSEDTSEDLSMPIVEEDIDGLSGLLFPFYDADTHMLYLAGKGDGNIRYFEITTEKPYLQYLMEFRSPAPQKGLGVMPKHGLDVGACEVFRFYKLVTLKGLIEPISMIVPRRSDTYQEDIYPMTAGTEPALSASEWLSGINRDPVLMSLKEGYKRPNQLVFKAPVKEKKSVVVNGIDLLENVPPRTENELLRMFFRQQDELRRLKEELTTKDVRIRQLELELNNLKNVSPNNV
ncbi:coronin-2B isoform X1 [Xyrichtys novacula]|uniref:Coronin-2B isoform X1 n=1 Tax=Xyrichtys novacula TaxID=13765 RepID=A0AAV1EKU8_XYRNO|nr:coronin-2B isoform X1 [Xyrichtys novacula]